MSTNKAIYEHQRVVSSVADELEYLAKCARSMGQAALADKLGECAYDIVSSCKNVQLAYTRDISSQLSESQKGVGETLMAILGMAPNPSPARDPEKEE